MIEIINLKKSFSKQKVLNNLNLKIETGSIFGIVGINGAGKSTLLRLLSGIYKADSGSILFDGNDVFDNSEVKKDIFFLADDPYYSINTTAKGLVDLYKTFYRFDEIQFEKYINKFKLNTNKPINSYSKGMRRQLFIAIALSIKPKYLFLDEAFDGLDPLARLTFKRALIELSEDTNCTVIISSHSLRELQDICDSYGLIDHGVITSSGQIVEELDKIHKYQLAFNRDLNKEDFFHLDVVSFSKTGKVIKLVVKGTEEQIVEKLEKMNPILIDEVSIDFEELFIYEVESRGYLHD